MVIFDKDNSNEGVLVLILFFTQHHLITAEGTFV